MDALFTVVVSPDLIPPDLVPSLLEALSDFEPVLLDQVATYLQQEQDANFQSQGATFGEPWAALAKATVKEKARRGFSEQPLVRYGRLASEVGQTVILSPDAVSVGINPEEVPYARRLQTGDESRNLPARVLVALTEDEIAHVQDLLDDWIEQMTGAPPGAVQFQRA